MQKRGASGVVELAAGPWAAQVLPARGMNTIALSFYGRPILRTPLSRREWRENPCAFGTPVLLPPNRTDRGRFVFDGACYQLPLNDVELDNHLHGVLHQRPFTVLDRSGRSVLGVYENDGSDYPFPFSMEVRCVLERAGYRQKFTVKNTGTRDMPLTFGLHTTFLEQALFRVDIGKRWVLDDRLLPTGDLAQLQREELAYLRGTCSRGKAIQGFYTAAGHTAQVGDILYEVSENFDHWVLWNGGGNQGFCTIEPLQRGVNALNSGRGLIRLKPGEAAAFETQFRYADPAKHGRPCALYIDALGRNAPKNTGCEKRYRRCPPADRLWNAP